MRNDYLQYYISAGNVMRNAVCDGGNRRTGFCNLVSICPKLKLKIKLCMQYGSVYNSTGAALLVFHYITIAVSVQDSQDEQALSSNSATDCTIAAVPVNARYANYIRNDGM